MASYPELLTILGSLTERVRLFLAAFLTDEGHRVFDLKTLIEQINETIRAVVVAEPLQPDDPPA